MDDTSIQVLYVEDEADIREVTEFALEDEGFELITCTSGQEALGKAAGMKADLILLDVMMPGMDGPTTLENLRSLPQFKKTPVIFMTAKVQPEQVAQYKSMGALGVISKPFNAMLLANEIRTMMNKNG